MSRAWLLGLPMLGIVVVTMVPFAWHAQKTRVETTAAEFLRRIHVGQQAFRGVHTGEGYAASLDSLLVPCPVGGGPLVTSHDVVALGDAGYDLTLRPVEGAVAGALDCHGRPLVSDYYAAASPRSVDSPGRQAFALTAEGRIYVFFDGIAPLEPDMAATGLATPLDALDAFKIP